MSTNGPTQRDLDEARRLLAQANTERSRLEAAHGIDSPLERAFTSVWLAIQEYHSGVRAGFEAAERRRGR